MSDSALNGTGIRQSPSKRRKIDTHDIAYLGPAGTYGHQAARAFAAYFQGDYDLLPCDNIKAVYESPSPFLVLPLQNTLHGPVIETVDCLFSVLRKPSSTASIPNIGEEVNEEGDEPVERGEARIIGDLDLPIRHCLVAKRGVEISDVKWIRSHEQALGQSSKYLDEYLPNASRIPWASTAGAAVSLLQDDRDGSGAAICSKSVLDDHPELHLLHEGTQSISNNYTRFILLSRSDQALSPLVIDNRPSGEQSTTSFYALPDVSLLPSILSEPTRWGSHYTIETIHARPVPAEERDDRTGRYAARAFLELKTKEEHLTERDNNLGAVIYVGSIQHRIEVQI